MVSVTDALAEIEATGRYNIVELIEVLAGHSTWHILTLDGEFDLNEDDEGATLVSLSTTAEIPEDDRAPGLTLEPIDLAAVLHTLPVEYGAVIEPFTFAEVLEPEDLHDLSDVLCRDAITAALTGTGGSADELLNHRFLVCVDDNGRPVASDAPGSEPTADGPGVFVYGESYGVFTPPIDDGPVRRLSGQELFFRVAIEMPDCDALWINEIPLFPGVMIDVLYDRHPRPECRVLPARSQAEIDLFLSQMHMAKARTEERDGDLLTVRGVVYQTTAVEERSYTFRLSDEPVPDGEIAAGHTEILCAGAIVDELARLQGAGADPRPARELFKLLPLHGVLSRQWIRTPEGSYQYALHPERFTRTWVSTFLPAEPAGDDPVTRELVRAHRAGAIEREALFPVLARHRPWFSLNRESDGAPALFSRPGAADPDARYLGLTTDPELRRGVNIAAPVELGRFLGGLPSETAGVIFEPSSTYPVALDRDDADAVAGWTYAGPLHEMLERGDGDASALLNHTYLVPVDDTGRPRVGTFAAMASIPVFSSAWALARHRDVHDLADPVARVLGDVLFDGLNARDDWDACWIDPASRLRHQSFEPFAPAAVDDLCHGRDPRPERHILHARTIAEIVMFLDTVRMSTERRHDITYVDDELVGRYTGEMMSEHPRTVSFHFLPVGTPGGSTDLGRGPSTILCAGKLADLVRLQLEQGGPDARSRARAFEALKMMPAGAARLPRTTLRTAYGAHIVREYPELATATWLRARADDR